MRRIHIICITILSIKFCLKFHELATSPDRIVMCWLKEYAVILAYDLTKFSELVTLLILFIWSKTSILFLSICHAKWHYEIEENIFTICLHLCQIAPSHTVGISLLLQRWGPATKPFTHSVHWLQLQRTTHFWGWDPNSTSPTGLF